MEGYQSAEFKKSMKIRLNYNNMMTRFVGEKGISEEEITAIKDQIEAAKKAMVKKRAEGGMDWRDLPYNQNEVVRDIIDYANSVKDQFDAFVVLGIGGSALGPIAVQQAINHPLYNELPREKRGGWPKFYVADNVDPERLSCLFDVIDPAKTLFNVISKSGGTSETMSQFMIIKEMLEEKLGKEETAKHIVCTTDGVKGNLRPICAKEGYKSFVIPAGVGGRFSEMTPVGLLPAAMTGIDIKAFLAGAAYMDELSQNDNERENIAYMYAILSSIAVKQGKNIHVMMPYADSLKYISDWFAQLWAESLGKKFHLDGTVAHAGQTPVKAVGVTDQHSQVQLYAEGPYDKMVVFLGVDKYRRSITIPKIYSEIPSLGFLGGVTQNALIQTEQVATEYNLLKSGKPNMEITLPEVNEFTLGELLYMFEVATGFAGELLQVNAFDQPGVEAGKNATYAMFGRPGYEAVKEELDNRPQPEKAYII
jgi:glucose-6-phosphate isomerase